MAIVWTGTEFTGTGGFVPSQFFADPSNNTYFYEQNYQAFYAASVNGSAASLVPDSNGNFNAVAITANTTLTSLNILQGSIVPCEKQLLGSKYDQYYSDPTNVVNIFSQNPGDYVITTITQALSGSNIAEAVLGLAPYFVNPQLHFSFNDIATSWPNGVALLESLNNIFQNLQSNNKGTQEAADRIKDFKKKLIRMQTETASQVRKVQSQIQQLEDQGTFSILASAFPDTFTVGGSSVPSGLQLMVKALTNSNAALANQLATYLPSNGVSQFLVGILNQLTGGIKPPILNPVDKILSDINSLENDLDIIATEIPTDGFGSLANQQQFINQISSILVNKINSIPVLSQVPPIPAMTDPNTIIQSISSYASQQLGQTVSNSNTSANKILQKLISTMTTAASSVTAPSDPTDPSAGGSLFNLGPLLAVFQGEIDQSITPPNITLSPDPALSAATQNRNNKQAAANAPGSPRNVPRGSGINILDEVWMRPRNTPVDGSKGDYQIVPGIKI